MNCIAVQLTYWKGTNPKSVNNWRVQSEGFSQKWTHLCHCHPDQERKYHCHSGPAMPQSLPHQRRPDFNTWEEFLHFQTVRKLSHFYSMPQFLFIPSLQMHWLLCPWSTCVSHVRMGHEGCTCGHGHSTAESSAAPSPPGPPSLAYLCLSISGWLTHSGLSCHLKSHFPATDDVGTFSYVYWLFV